MQALLEQQIAAGSLTGTGDQIRNVTFFEDGRFSKVDDLDQSDGQNTLTKPDLNAKLTNNNLPLSIDIGGADASYVQRKI